MSCLCGICSLWIVGAKLWGTSGIYKEVPRDGYVMTGFLEACDTKEMKRGSR